MARANQPTWDFLAGGEASPPGRLPLREPLKQSTVVRADANTEDIRAQLRAAQYELDSIKQERELNELQHQQDLRDLQTRAENDFRRAQAAEAACEVAKKKAEALARDFQEVQDRATNEKTVLEKKIRELKDDAQSLREELEEATSALSSHERQHKHAFDDLQQRHTTLQASVEDIQQDLSGRVAALQNVQQKLKESEEQKGQLENEVLRLKAQSGDNDTLAVVKKELSEQVAYIKKLEGTNREQAGEIKQLRKSQQSVEIVQEEKHALEAKVKLLDDVRKELAESQLQRRILEDEKVGWTSFLQSQVTGDGDFPYTTPEELAKAFLQERLERLDLVDKLGALQPELSVKEDTIRHLEQEKASLVAEVDQLRTSTANRSTANPSDGKAQLRLQRQKDLVVKEVEYLRAQLKIQEAEEAEFTPEQVNEQHTQRIHELEDMVSQYRAEIQTLQTELAKLEGVTAPPQSPKKRSREEEQVSDERLGELQRKSRALQNDIDKLQSRNKVLEGELQASVLQVKALKDSTKTRILEFRNNPTAEAEAVKMSTLQTLRTENAALLAQLEGKPGGGTKVVPISTLENVRLQMDELEAQRAQTEKKTLRLKQIWGAKSLEFREAVCSILGWRLDFMPNGRVKVTSILYPTSFYGGEQQENSIVFDGENGTMKVSGGPQSMFAKEIKGLIEFWVEGRKEIPCFLAALTLEFYERSTRAQKM